MDAEQDDELDETSTSIIDEHDEDALIFVSF
jgi:hypothetical protein